MTSLGIVAGGGNLPIAIAECAIEAGRPVFVAALQGIADESVARFPHAWVSLGQTGRTLSLLRQHDCSDVLLAGQVTRPKWSDIRFDATALRKLPRVMSAALQGDDALLRSLVALLEGEGFHVVSVAEAAPELIAKEGVFGKHHPSAQQERDIDLGIRVVEGLGTFDIGQAAVVCDSLVLAVEAAEGTDNMIARVSTLSENVRGTLQKPRGVLIKARKSTQDGKTDLPVIGVQTVTNAAAAGLAGLAVEAGSTLIVNRKAVVQSADEARLFLLGFPSSRQSA
jgi:UDP-2,3-diacylglucosamine hydrolase